MEFNEVKDSGVRQEFETGSVRDTQEGKGRYDLIPVSMLIRLAKHYENGAKKYGDRNWEKGQPLSRYYNSALRHLFYWFLGLTDEDHLAAAIWNITAILDHEISIETGSLPVSLADAGYQKIVAKYKPEFDR